MGIICLVSVASRGRLLVRAFTGSRCALRLKKRPSFASVEKPPQKIENDEIVYPSPSKNKVGKEIIGQQKIDKS